MKTKVCINENVARQCEAGLKLVPIVVKRASGNSASHCKAKLLRVPS